jgi:4-amino-4-deoxy-L-arabinose transferase-like glycosyltransferase
MSIQDRLLSRPAPPFARAWLLRRVGAVAGGALAAALLVFLATYNLETYPKTWFDEGSHLHVPKALVQAGVYADRSAEGFRYYGPTTGVGPTVLLPIALAFKLAGIGLLQARLVMAVYLLAAIALVAEAARRRYGLPTACLAAALLITAPGVDLLYLGRQALGEVPALAYLMLGLLAWWRSVDGVGRRGAALALAAVGFGLAAMTKNQFALLLVPTIALLFVADRVYYRQLAPRFYVVPLLGVVVAMALNYLAQLLVAVAGTGDVWTTLRLLREASGGAIFVFSPARSLSSLKFLVSADVFGYWGIPALAYGVFLARERSRAGLRDAFLVAFVGVGLAWFAFGSIGWPRYAFPALAALAILTAKLLVDLVQALGRRLDAHAPAAARGGPALALALAVGIALVVAAPLQNEARTILTATNRDPQAVAAYLNANVPETAVIETWEPELGFLTDHAYHYPPSGWLDRAVRAKWLQSDALIAGYDPTSELTPAYLVVGPFGKYTGVYAPALDRLPASRVASIGEYDIYRVG